MLKFPMFFQKFERVSIPSFTSLEKIKVNPGFKLYDFLDAYMLLSTGIRHLAFGT